MNTLNSQSKPSTPKKLYMTLRGGFDIYGDWLRDGYETQSPKL